MTVSPRMPPLNSVRAFCVAAKHLNFSRAAEELSVTQGAVSKHVIALEDFIGARLFERMPGGLALTGEGKSLYQTVDPAFDILSSAFERFSRRPPRSNIFRLSTIGSFASQFLVPRLRDFQTSLPHIELEILTSDRLIDLGREEVDVSVRFGAGEWDGLVSTPLDDALLTPVCAPQVFDEMAGRDLPGLFADTRRIQIFASNEWNKWSDVTGVDLSDCCTPFYMEDFVVALHAVLSGYGVALLPDLLVRKHLAEGRLKRFSDIDVTWGWTYHIAHVAGAERRPIVKEVLDWLKMAVRAET